MARADGLTTLREPKRLLADNTEERPADLMITGWTIPTSDLTRHAMDVATPLVDSGMSTMSHANRLLRAKTVGTAGLDAEQKKIDNIGLPADRRFRGNSLSMKERCRLNGINFIPIALEGDGHASKKMMRFIKNVSDTAHHLRDANSATFKSYFVSRIANILHQTTAHLSIRQCASARQKLLSYSSIPLAGLTRDNDLSQELQTTLPAYVCKRREWRQRNSNLGVRVGSF
jgi:hypothetical protein